MQSLCTLLEDSVVRRRSAGCDNIERRPRECTGGKARRPGLAVTTLMRVAEAAASEWLGPNRTTRFKNEARAFAEADAPMTTGAGSSRVTLSVRRG